MSPGCSLHPVGDSHALERLRDVVDRLTAAVRDGDDRGLRRTVLEAAAVAQSMLRDPNPRTRAQARGLALAVQLVRGDRRPEALQLLDGELRRSFPGQAELPANT